MSTFHEEDICFKSEHQPDGEQTSPGLWWLRWCNSLDCSVSLSFVPRLLFNKHITHLSTYHTQHPCLLFRDTSWHFLWGGSCWPFRSASILKPSVVVQNPCQSLLCAIPDTSVPHLTSESSCSHQDMLGLPGWCRSLRTRLNFPSSWAGGLSLGLLWLCHWFTTNTGSDSVSCQSHLNSYTLQMFLFLISTLKDRMVKICPSNQCYSVVINFCLMGWSWNAFWSIHCVDLLFFVFV